MSTNLMQAVRDLQAKANGKATAPKAKPKPPLEAAWKTSAKGNVNPYLTVRDKDIGGFAVNVTHALWLLENADAVRKAIQDMPAPPQKK